MTKRNDKLLAILMIFGLVVSLSGFSPSTMSAEAQQPTSAPLKQLIDEIWAKLRGHVPRTSARAEDNQRTQIAGVRGAETTTSTLKPYWKDDKTTDPVYAKEVQSLNQAMKLADAGKLTTAAKAFDGFLKRYPESRLKSTAQFGLGLAYAELGQKDRGLAALRAFKTENPKHPLTPDATRVIQTLELH